MANRVAEEETASLDLADLRAFCLVVDHRSVTAASKALGETKGNVSRRVTRLEHALGVSLLRRSPRAVVPTEDGSAYRLQLGKALELLDEASQAVRQSRSTPRGHLRVTAPSDIASRLAPLIVEFGARYPEITLDLLLTQTVLDLDANQVDVALRAARSLPDSSLVAHRLHESGGALYAAPAYLREHRAPRHPDQLERHAFLAFTDTRGHGSITLRRADSPRAETSRVRVRSVVTAQDFSFLLEATLAWWGIAFLPTLNVERHVAEGKLARVLDGWVGESSAFYLLYQGGRLLPSKVRVFRDFMLDAFGPRAPPR